MNKFNIKKMNNFTGAYKNYKSLKNIGSYRLCWIPLNDIGLGIYSVIEFFDEEISKIDKNKCEIILL
jgi:hypothetical protein